MTSLKTSASDMVNNARARIEEIETSDLIIMMEDPNVVIVDIRDINFGLIQRALITKTFSPRKAKNMCFIAHQAGVQRSLWQLCRIWVLRQRT